MKKKKRSETKNSKINKFFIFNLLKELLKNNIFDTIMMFSHLAIYFFFSFLHLQVLYFILIVLKR